VRQIPQVPPVPPLTPLGLPNVQSAAAVVMDLDGRTILFGKNVDRARYIASTSKIFAAIAVRRHGIDLDRVTAITMEDARYARGGSRTHLDVNLSFRNQDLLRAMLIASDNRAVTAVGRGAGLSPDELVGEMNTVARELGLKRTHFTDPTGLNGNWSTAREMALAMRAILQDPVLAEILATRYTTITTVGARPRALSYANTNRILHRDRWKVLGGKTGFTDLAQYCLVTAVEVNGRRLVFVLLGARGELTRYADFMRIVSWMEGPDHGAAEPVIANTADSAAVPPQKSRAAR
jgi:D-alanyl-D-alanine endopeptidase (penicillin-binding protein 7)